MRERIEKSITSVRRGLRPSLVIVAAPLGYDWRSRIGAGPVAVG
jgi:hypothetical protein